MWHLLANRRNFWQLAKVNVDGVLQRADTVGWQLAGITNNRRIFHSRRHADYTPVGDDPKDGHEGMEEERGMDGRVGQGMQDTDIAVLGAKIP